MTKADLERLRAASCRVASLTLGRHECEFCPENSTYKRNGEYRYCIRNGEIYSAPVMILRYIEMHGYRLPEVFLEHLKEVGGLVWDWPGDTWAGPSQWWFRRRRAPLRRLQWTARPDAG